MNFFVFLVETGFHPLARSQSPGLMIHPHQPPNFSLKNKNKNSLLESWPAEEVEIIKTLVFGSGHSLSGLTHFQSNPKTKCEAFGFQMLRTLNIMI